MKSLFIIIFLLSAFSTTLHSQNVTGTVFGETEKGKEPLEGAVIKWLNSKKGTLTNSNGKFELSKEGITDLRISVHYIGYKKDTISFEFSENAEIILKNTETTQQITVEDELKGTYIENKDVKTEVVSQVELKKDACCDLSGCFGKNTSVDVAVTDILTNTKELKVLGLEGAYTQILIDNMPIMSGLNTKFGVTSIPGTLINKIMISKGSNSVIQGYESISGIMNVLLKDYGTSDRLLVNGFLNGALETQLNLNATTKVSKNLSTLFAFQTLQEPKKTDDNGDKFLDMPLIKRYMFYNKWNYGSEKEDNTHLTVAAKYLDERRIGGQQDFNYKTDKGSNLIYGQTVDIQNGDLYARLSKDLKGDSRIKVFLSGSFFNQYSYYGTTVYDAKQRNFYFNALYELPVAEENYLRIGASYKYENIGEDISIPQTVTNKTYAGSYEKIESVPGLYTEGSFDFHDIGLSLIGGIRFDYHNKYNLITTPRFLARYQLSKLTVVRLSMGTGFRTVNLFSEYANLLASGKNIIINGELEPERMINYGIDILQYFDFRWMSGNINFDFYRTDFSNRIIPDYKTNNLAVTFSNYTRSGSNVFQIEVNSTILRNLELKLGYKFVDLFYYSGGEKFELPFNPVHRISSGISYSPSSKSWIANMTVQWFGKQEIPYTGNYPTQYQRPSESESYALVNFQFTKNFRNFEIYAGVENLLNFTQKNPIISPENPFSPYFDTSYIWGPVRGREYYAGLRFMLQ